MINCEVDLSMEQWKFILETLEDAYIDVKTWSDFRDTTIECIKQQLPLSGSVQE